MVTVQRQTAGGRRQEADGRRQTAGGRRQEADGRQQVAGRRWQEADSRRQTAGNRWQAADGSKSRASCRLAPASCRLAPTSCRLPPVTIPSIPVSVHKVVEFKQIVEFKKVGNRVIKRRSLGVVVVMVAAVGLSAGSRTFGQTTSAAPISAAASTSAAHTSAASTRATSTSASSIGAAASTSAAHTSAASTRATSTSASSISAVASTSAVSTSAASTGAAASTNIGLIEATRKLKGDSENLIRLQEAELAKATEKLEQLRTLVADGLVAKNELQQSEENLSAMQKRLETTRQQVADADRTISDIVASEQLAKTQAATAKLLAKSRSFITPTILRYNGQTNWAIANLGEIQGFFSSKFGRSLPTSAVGQSGTHNQLGFDHRHAVDVALHPDSVEGKVLISYLQSQGIPFLAFRAAVPGVATGPHIHIGPPSHRLV